MCLSVREDISGTTRASLPNFLCMLPMVVARSYSSIVAIRYVLWFCGGYHVFFYSGPYSGINFAMKD